MKLQRKTSTETRRLASLERHGCKLLTYIMCLFSGAFQGCFITEVFYASALLLQSQDWRTRFAASCAVAGPGRSHCRRDLVSRLRFSFRPDIFRHVFRLQTQHLHESFQPQATVFLSGLGLLRFFFLGRPCAGSAGKYSASLKRSAPRLCCAQ